jgi:metal-responsive CopG/Arc/MetJ family transcriptional regulator
MIKEKTDKIINFAIKNSLYEKFKKICDKRYKSLSEQIRELIVDKIKYEEEKEEKKE